jgi:hypothetical protein
MVAFANGPAPAAPPDTSAGVKYALWLCWPNTPAWKRNFASGSLGGIELVLRRLMGRNDLPALVAVLPIGVEPPPCDPPAPEEAHSPFVLDGDELGDAPPSAN